MTELESIRRKRGREQAEALELSFVKFLAFSCCLLPFFLFVGTFDGERTTDTRKKSLKSFDIEHHNTQHFERDVFTPDGNPCRLFVKWR